MGMNKYGSNCKVKGILLRDEQLQHTSCHIVSDAIFFLGLFCILFFSFVLNYSGFGVFDIVFRRWGFQLMGFGACVVGPCGFFWG